MISRTTNTPELKPIPVQSFVLDGTILALWRQGLDTCAIAKQLHIREHEVANKLWHLRNAA